MALADPPREMAPSSLWQYLSTVLSIHDQKEDLAAIYCNKAGLTNDRIK
jgi:hypothetical protein